MLAQRRIPRTLATCGRSQALATRGNIAREGRRRPVVGIGLWLCAILVSLGALWLIERDRKLGELTAETERLHAIASQRVDQHDAHLTALSAIASADAAQRAALFHEVADAIMRFYPRVSGIALVPLTGDAGAIEIGSAGPDLRGAIRGAAMGSSGVPVLLPHPAQPGTYLLVKRSPNTDTARFGLALAIDAAALLESDAAYWDGAKTTRTVGLPDGPVLIAEGVETAAPQFARPLASATQPLLLEASIALTPASLLPPGPVVLIILMISAAALGLSAFRRQRARIRTAEQRAELSGMETRLSHAARVNALGEMASGIAHELTQPLTAVLAQAQAARHLNARGDAERVSTVLDEIVGQTRRASSILERLRTWTRPQERRPEAVDLRDCVRVAASLLERVSRDAESTLSVDGVDAPLPVLADRIEMEQVLFNLIRNALDAVHAVDGPRSVTVSLSRHGTLARVDVTDNGAGLAPDAREKLFTPFVTTKPGGTGLGLALSQRLVERAGGEITLLEAPQGARFRVSLPLAEPQKEAAE